MEFSTTPNLCFNALKRYWIWQQVWKKLWKFLKKIFQHDYCRIHQLNENVDSVSMVSGFEMFSSLCSDFKVTFLIYFNLGWFVNSAMSVYLKFKIRQNGTTNVYERSHFRPNFATYKCMSMPPIHLKYNQNINVKCSILQ